nr:MAG TPA: hypothetical protein [Caudoviricetes sp.]
MSPARLRHFWICKKKKIPPRRAGERYREMIQQAG